MNESSDTMKSSYFAGSKPFVAAAIIAAVSIVINIYQTLQPARTIAAPKQALPAALIDKLEAGNSALTDTEGTKLLLNLHEEVNRNSTQLDLILAALSKTEEPAVVTPEQANRDAARKLASQERKKDWEEQMAFHLTEDERAVVFHERWMLKNEAQLRHNSEELNRIEQSGIDAIANYEARNKK